MRYSSSLLVAALIAHASAHGVVTSIQGANGVDMPGLSVIDGTPRDCSSNGCGSQADTAIVRNRELGTSKASALGRTQGGGPVDAAAAIGTFMGTSAAPAVKRDPQRKSQQGGKVVEQMVSKMAGTGASSGLPTAGDDGTVTMTFRQVNQDGAGPLNAQIDATSGGTDPAAFKNAEVTQDVPGIGIGGLSAATIKDFPVKVQMPAGMTCDGTVGDVQNVCVVRVQNSALAGPFGGSAAFTQSTAARKRAIEYRLRKRHMSRGVFGLPEEDKA